MTDRAVPSQCQLRPTVALAANSPLVERIRAPSRLCRTGAAAIVRAAIPRPEETFMKPLLLRLAAGALALVLGASAAMAQTTPATPPATTPPAGDPVVAIV